MIARRRFLEISAAGVAGAVLGVNALPSVAYAQDVAETKSRFAGGFNLGVASYSLRNFPLDKALEMVKALRTPYVNFKSFHVPYEKSPQELAAIRQRVEAAGFKIVGGGTIEFAKDTDDDVRHFFEYARNAGMPLIVGTCNPPVVPRLEKFAKEFNIKVALHNHGPEDTNFPSPYDVLAAVKNLDPRVGLSIDFGHTVRTGTDVVNAISYAGPRVLDLHAKDLRDLKDKESQCIVGEGAIPFPEIFRALDVIHFEGCVNLEYEIDAEDPLPGMKQSMAYMRGVRAGLARVG
jgi:sugar phosphate isomerase/epimerase